MVSPIDGEGPYAAELERPWRRGLALTMFVAITTLNIMDRQILSIANEALKRDLLLTDTQLGLLSGFAFSCFYAVFGLPMAWIADRKDRSRLIAIVMMIWSGFTALSGFASSFGQLAACRVGVAIGESGATPPLYSLVSHRYPPERRALALAIISLGSSLGTFLALFFGGYVVEHWGWRSAFRMAAVPGFVVALATIALVHDPRSRALTERRLTPPLRAQFRAIFAIRAHRWLLLGVLFSSMALYANITWLPSFFQRVHHWTPSQAGRTLGVTLGLAGVPGALLAGVCTNRWTRRDPAAPAKMACILLVVSAPLLAAAIFASSPWLALFLFAPALAAIQGSIVAFNTGNMNLAPPDARGLCASIGLLVFNIGGLSLGAGLVGLISDASKAYSGVHSLQLGLLVGPAAAAIGIVAYAISAARMSARKAESPQVHMEQLYGR